MKYPFTSKTITQFCPSLTLIVFLVLQSCNQSATQIQEEKENLYLPPVIVRVDTCPAPQSVSLDSALMGRISVNKTSHGSFKVQKISGLYGLPIIAPRAYKPDMPKANFTNYDTSDGLALSTIVCGMKDSKGKLWFGSQGGGVSCYNGKGFINYSVAEGLAGNNVRGIVEDNNGDIWIAADLGISRYNGKRFTNYFNVDGIDMQNTRCMIKDRSGNIWIGTLRNEVFTINISLTDPKDVTFKRFELPEIISQGIRSILEDSKGNIWIGAGYGGIAKYNPSNRDNPITIYTTGQGLASEGSRSMIEDSDGNIWIGAWGGGLCLYQPEKDIDGAICFATFSETSGLKSNFIRAMHEDRQGNLWIGHWNGGVSRLDLNLFKNNAGLDLQKVNVASKPLFVNYTTDHGLAHNNLQCIVEDNAGYLWFGTHANGISKFNGETIMALRLTKDLIHNRVKRIAEDAAGNLWFTAEDGGANRYDGNEVINYNLFNFGLGTNFFSLLHDSKESIWFGFYGTIAIYDPSFSKSGEGNVSMYNWKTSQFGSRIVSMHEDDLENVWIGENNAGLTCFDGEFFTTYTSDQGLVHNNVNCLTHDDQNNVWIGTGGGISQFDGKSFKNYSTDQGLNHNDVSSIVADPFGHIWIGSRGGGINRFDGKTFISFTSEEGLPDDVIRDLKFDKEGTLWIGTNQGLSKLQFEITDSKSKNKAIIQSGKLELSNKELTEYTPVFENFGNKTGYPIEDLYDNGMMISEVGLPAGDKKDVGVIWGGYGNEKVIRFDPSAIIKNKDPLTPYIESIAIKEETLPWYLLASTEIDSAIKAQQEIMIFGRSMRAEEREDILTRFEDIQFTGISSFNPVPEMLVLPHRHNQLTIEYGAIETGRPQLVRYQYMLDGYDKEWSPVTAKASATYGNMFEGQYVFKVKAMSPDGIWSDPIQYSFSVLPPWWRSWWAYGIYVILLAIAVWVVHVFQKRRVLKLEKQRAQKRELEQAKEIEKAYTELKNTQSQLIQSEKMASLGELTAGIAHEIQNPLNFVNNFSEVSKELAEELKEESMKTDIDKELIAEIATDIADNQTKIHHHGQRASGIVKGMLEHSRTSDGKKELTDLNALADEYLRLAYHGLRAKDKSFNADFKTDFDETLPKIKLIPQDIGRVLLNLINNAFFAVNQKTARHSERSVESKDYKPEVIVTTVLSPAGGGKGGVKNILISVKDNGEGIPELIRDKIFQPFFTTKPTGSGTGLGLSLSYDIVKAHGGELTVESPPAGEAGKEGEGSEFIIQLPIV